MENIVAFSGGKDSTAVALWLWERGEDFKMLFTPTGRELPELAAHMKAVAARVGKSVILPTNYSLDFWIKKWNALPNNRQRWCTRVVKIEPCIAYLTANPGSTLCIGLRADEPVREGLYGDHAIYRYPLREAGLDLAGVVALNHRHELMPLFRTDCDICPYQRLGEWFGLWRDYPALWIEGEAYEEVTGRTFRSAKRDSWPAALKDMRIRFEAGDVPERSLKNMARDQACRVCSL